MTIEVEGAFPGVPGSETEDYGDDDDDRGAADDTPEQEGGSEIETWREC